MAKVEIRPLPIKKWHGKEGKEDFSQPKVIEVLYDVEKACYATGLSEEETIKYSKEKGKVENLKEVFKTAKGRIFTALLSVTPIVYEEEKMLILEWLQIFLNLKK